MKFKDFMKAGKFVKMDIGDSGIFELACDPFTLQSAVNRFGKETVEVKLIDSETGEEKVFSVKSAGVANQLSKFEEGDMIKISKLDSDDGKGRWKVGPAKASRKDEDEEEEEAPRRKAPKGSGLETEDDEEEAPRRKKRVEEDEEEETPKKKRKVEDDEEEDEDRPKKKKRSSDEVNPDDIDF